MSRAFPSRRSLTALIASPPLIDGVITERAQAQAPATRSPAPIGRLREVNRLVDGEVWGERHAEVCPAYDDRPLWEALRAQIR